MAVHAGTTGFWFSSKIVCGIWRLLAYDIWTEDNFIRNFKQIDYKSLVN